jgi:hypothetical protein
MQDLVVSRTPVAVAPEPLPPLKVTTTSEACEKHWSVPSPCRALRDTETTSPEVPNVAVAVAPVPPPPVKLTVGALVYPFPPFVTVTPFGLTT